MSEGRRIVVVSPCRDEAAYMRQTLDSMIAQTLKPALWIIVDDGSQDESPTILNEYAQRVDWIRVIRREDRGRRSVGPGVIEAFYAGLEGVELDEFDYVCKLDLDLELPPRYFEILVERMEADPKLGTCSGKPYFVDPRGELRSEGCGDENSVGMTKLYRTTCFQDIGGFVREVMWDGIDGHLCRMKGWRARSWDEPELRFTHLRPMGSSDCSVWKGRKRHGFGQYYMGTAPLYMLASSLYRAARWPYVVGGLGMMVGYVAAALQGVHRYEDREFRRFLRRYQWDCLLRGKTAATKRLEQQMIRDTGPSAQRSASESAR